MSELNNNDQQKRAKLTLHKGTLQLKSGSRDVVKNNIVQKSGSVTVEIKKKKGAPASNVYQASEMSEGSKSDTGDHQLTDKEMGARAHALQKSKEIAVRLQSEQKAKEEELAKIQQEALKQAEQQEEIISPDATLPDDSDVSEALNIMPILDDGINTEKTEHKNVHDSKISPPHLSSKDTDDDEEVESVSKKNKYRKGEVSKKRKITVVDAIREEKTIEGDNSVVEIGVEIQKIPIRKIKKPKSRRNQKTKLVKEVYLYDRISVKDLAAQMCEKVNVVLKELMKQGESVNIQ